MANQYGLKEVADVYLIELNDANSAALISNGNMGVITAEAVGENLVFKVGDKYVVGPDGKDGSGATHSSNYVQAKFKFDSLKTSNIEVSSEETSAKGGKGNPELISWSYGKTATLTLTDALLTPETLELMYGAKKKEAGEAANIITIDAKSFPNSYIILGTTVLRPLEGGDDKPFGFVVPKGKINVGGTLTMEAEGDPSTFEMTVKALAQDFASAKDVLLQFVVPSVSTTFSAVLGKNDTTTGVSVTIDGAAGHSNSDDIDVEVAGGVVTIKAKSGTELQAGSTYVVIVKNASNAEIGRINVTIVA